MKNQKKWLGILVILLVFGLNGCASSPKMPKNVIVFDQSLAEDQMAILHIPRYFWIRQFNGTAVSWMTHDNNGMDVKIPSGNNEIVFHWDNKTHGYVTNVSKSINYISGRRYKLVTEITGSRSAAFSIIETTNMREPGPDEQILYVKQNNWGGILVVLDKNTNNERILLLDPLALVNEELRVIIPKGEHTFDIALMGSAANSASFQPEGVLERQFTASSDPVRYLITLNIKSGWTSSSVTYSFKKQ